MMDAIVLYNLMIDTIVFYSFLANRPWPWFKVTGMWNSKTFCVNFIILIWLECSLLVKLIGMMNLALILFYPLDIQGREPYLCDFVINKGLYLDI